MDFWLSYLVTSIILGQWGGPLLALHTYQCNTSGKILSVAQRPWRKLPGLLILSTMLLNFTHPVLSKKGKGNRKNNGTEARSSKNDTGQVVRSTVVWAGGKNACPVRDEKTNNDNRRKESIKSLRGLSQVALEASSVFRWFLEFPQKESANNIHNQHLFPSLSISRHIQPLCRDFKQTLGLTSELRLTFSIVSPLNQQHRTLLLWWKIHVIKDLVRFKIPLLHTWCTPAMPLPGMTFSMLHSILKA